MIYLDSSALMKVVRAEDESGDLTEWLRERPDQPKVTSELGRIEILRAARRAGEPALVEARTVLADLDLVPLNRTVQDLACDVGAASLRTLDALHLASAMLLADALQAFVAYDTRLVEAARELGLPVITPGRAGDFI